LSEFFVDEVPAGLFEVAVLSALYVLAALAWWEGGRVGDEGSGVINRKSK
jgi:hypothetical protein